jgi:hypothetical protein
MLVLGSLPYLIDHSSSGEAFNIMTSRIDDGTYDIMSRLPTVLPIAYQECRA